MICTGTAAPEEKMISMVYTGDKGDFSYLQSAFEGLNRAEKDFSFTVRDIPWNISSPVDPVIDSNGTQSDAVVIMGDIMNGYEQAVADSYPETPLILIDGSNISGPAARSIYFSMYGTSYLAGLLAAEETKTGKVGIIAGVDAPVLHGFIDGFSNGTTRVNPEVHLNISYIADDYSGFSMPEKAGELTQEMYRNGTDVIYQIAGSSGMGVIDTAEKLPGLLIIGSDADQSGLAPETVLGSVIKNLDSVVYNEVKDIYTESYAPGSTVIGLEEDGSSLVLNPRFKNLSSVIESHKTEAIAKEREYRIIHPQI